MSNFNIFGFGGIEFSYGSNTATFPYSPGQITYIPEFDEIINANKKIYRRFSGFRVKIECNLISAETDMYQQVQNLIYIINASTVANAGITIYPEYASGNSNNLSVTGMLYNSDFRLEDIVKREGIQGLNLEFISDELVGYIPVFVNSGSVTWTDSASVDIIDSDGEDILLVG